MDRETSSVDLFRVRMALSHPHRAAHGVEDDREVVLVAVTGDDGVVGWGECPALRRPTYTAEYLDGAWSLLRDVLVPALAGGREEATVGHPMARAALADAVLDARLRRRDVGLVEHLGGHRHPVATTTVVSLSDWVVADSIDRILAEVAATPGAVKLKIAPGRDLEPLRAIRSSFPDRHLAADANGSYSTAELASGVLVSALDDLGLIYLEQPLPGIVANAELAGRMQTPVCLDEPIDSLEAARVAVAMGAMAVLNVKPTRVGGVEVAAALVDLARSEGIDAFVGGMLETGVGRAGALAVAMLPGCTLPTDLGPSDRYWTEDVTAPLVADGSGRLSPPDGPGIGVVPVKERLETVTVDRFHHFEL